MSTPRVLSKDERAALWAEVRREFPDDEMMQEVHFVRLLHAAQLKGFTREQKRAYFNRFIPAPTKAPSKD